MQALRCQRLSKTFGGVRALDGVTLRFPASGVVSIIGPNGAGKTTLLNVITGFLEADEGAVALGERDISALAPHDICRLGVTRSFQDLRLIQHVSALENVLLARPSQRGERLLPAILRVGVASQEADNRREATRLLDFVGLASKKDDLAGELSYGQQKLLALACCLATEGDVMLLDEPVAGVHPDLVDRILGLLVTLGEQGKLIVFIEHDIAAVRRAAEVVIVMDEGRVIARGAPDDVLCRPEIMEAYVG